MKDTDIQGTGSHDNGIEDSVGKKIKEEEIYSIHIHMSVDFHPLVCAVYKSRPRDE